MRKQISLAIFLTISVLVLTCSFCNTSTPAGTHGPDPTDYNSLDCTAWDGIDSIDYLDSITCPKEFERINGAPLNKSFSGVKSIKLVYEIATSKMYFMESRKFDLHYTFCRDLLGYAGTHAIFNTEQYKAGTERKYFLASINYYTASNIYTLEFAPIDHVTKEEIRMVFLMAKNKVYFSKELAFLPTSQEMSTSAQLLASEIRVTDKEKIYDGQTYQALNLDKGYGYLKKLDVSKVETTYLSRHDIVFTNGVPNAISVVAGIITTEFQTPLSHINVLSRNRGTPNMGLRNGWTNDYILSLVEKLVYLEVTGDTFVLREATLAEAESFWAQTEPTDTVIPPADDSTARLFDMSELDHDSIHLVGAKAANFAELKKMAVGTGMDPVRVPEGGFAIPFYFYFQHMRTHGLDSEAIDMISDPTFMADIGVRQSKLATLQKHIIDAPIDSAFLKLVEDKIRKDGTWRRMRFRSSTNVEDLKEFNGAGLYTSETGYVDGAPGDQTVDMAIKLVWASLWNFRAFEEREYFNVNHMRTAMGILVHRSFPNEQANGVAITRNILTPDLWGYTINVQLGETSIVNPPAGITSDFFIFHLTSQDAMENPQIEYISHSNLVRPNEIVLTEAESVLLAKYLGAIKTWFYFDVFKDEQDTDFSHFAMDVEFKLETAERVLYIKQARPYK